MKYEIWLGDHYSHFERGVAHLDDGRDLELASWVHTATYGDDSVLIDDVEHYDLCRYPLRWFTKPQALELYDWDDISSVLFHNASQETIRIDRFGTLAPGASMEVDLYKEV